MARQVAHPAATVQVGLQAARIATMVRLVRVARPVHMGLQAPQVPMDQAVHQAAGTAAMARLVRVARQVHTDQVVHLVA